jgi:hypothetical protein
LIIIKVEQIQTEVNDDYSRDESGYTVYNINDKIDYSVDNTEIGDVLSFFIIDINGPSLEIISHIQDQLHQTVRIV